MGKKDKKDKEKKHSKKHRKEKHKHKKSKHFSRKRRSSSSDSSSSSSSSSRSPHARRRRSPPTKELTNEFVGPSLPPTATRSCDEADEASASEERKAGEHLSVGFENASQSDGSMPAKSVQVDNRQKKAGSAVTGIASVEFKLEPGSAAHPATEEIGPAMMGPLKQPEDKVAGAAEHAEPDQFERSTSLPYLNPDPNRDPDPERENPLEDQPRRVRGPSFPPSNWKPERNESTFGPMPSAGMFDGEDDADDDEAAIQEKQRKHAHEWNRVMGRADIVEPEEAKSSSKHEEWMTVLPPEINPILGAGAAITARQFSKKERKPRGDTSGWTDTPADRERKAKERQEQANQVLPDRKRKKENDDIYADVYEPDRESRKLAKEIAEYNEASRPKSLFEEHLKDVEKQTKEKKKTGPGKREWVPFDRERDLQIPKAVSMMGAKKMLNDAKGLNTMFSSSRFL